MTHFVRNTIAMMMVAVLMLVASATEDAGAESRRKEKCENRGTIKVTVDAYNYVKNEPFMMKPFTWDRDDCCAGDRGDCDYDGPDKNALFKEWKLKYPFEVNGLIKFFQKYKPHVNQSRGVIIFNAVCDREQHFIHQGRLGGTSAGELVMSQ